MGDIHIGSALYNTSKQMCAFNVYFHIPNPRTNNSFPGTDKYEAPDLLPSEVHKIQNGAIIEVKKIINVSAMWTPQQILNMAQVRWDNVTEELFYRLDKEHQLYGTVLNRPV